MADGRNKNSIDMTTGAILPKLLVTTLPLMASSVLQLLFNAADVVVVGNFASEHSLAAVGSTGALVNLITNLFIGLSIGANSLASFYFGARDAKNLSKTAHNAILLSVLGGAALTVIGVVFAEKFLIWMQTPGEVLGLGSTYITVYFAGSIPVLVFNFGSSLLRAKGDTKRPLYYLTVAGVINVVLNLIFVIVFKMDVAGVALATIIAQTISAYLVMRCLVRETDEFRIEWSKLKEGFDGAIVLEILRIGIPAGIQGIVFSLSNVVIQSSINGFGPVVMAGSAAAQNVEGFVWVSMNAFAQTVLTFVSQNVGARKYDRIKPIMIITLVCSALTGVILGNLCDIFSASLVRIFDQRPEVVSAGVVRFSLVCRYYFLCGLMDVMVGVLRGMGYSVTPTVVSLLGACGLRLLWIFTVFQIPSFHTEFMLFLSYPLSWIVTFLIHVLCYAAIRRRWAKLRVAVA
ncbi:MAG: MATE family efflux transporter [Thermoguttaceae bacterium]|nr:MATE family efflux transporter [Thermoguttaceae bacterium]MBQ2039634.1 MATE family efflux transporter [Thermoguttaceae bacterium]MBQ2554937.1 MATE family efflux transporter [Thermoguttaceae bacterium]MBQ3821958.1 MATE family efflux transporter [Thermoguttaceae bacterium]MBQ4080284.1 MATE family efflux transporter [Thermoguttaceae bacterium]